MPDERLIAPWRQVEPRLRALGDGLSASLAPEEREWFREFLDANELGLALEMLADWLSEDETPITDADRAEMLDLGEAMGNKARVASPLRLCPPAEADAGRLSVAELQECKSNSPGSGSWAIRPDDVCGRYENLLDVGGLGRRLAKLEGHEDSMKSVDRFLHDSSYAPQRALAAAVVMLLASIVVLLLPSSWEIMGGQLGLVCSLVLALTALIRYCRQRSSV